MDHTLNNNVLGIEYLNNELYKGPDIFISTASLIAFIGGRHVISQFYDNRQDILCNPITKVIILFSIIYMNMKNIKLSILLFFLYILFIENYIFNECNKEYIQNIPTPTPTPIS